MRLYMLRHTRTGELFAKQNKGPQTYTNLASAQKAIAGMSFIDSTDLSLAQMEKMSDWEIKRHRRRNPLWRIVEYELIETRIVA